MPSTACLPLAASGPVSAMPKPILIGSPDCAAAPFAIAAAAMSASRQAPMRLSINGSPRVLVGGILCAIPAGAPERATSRFGGPVGRFAAPVLDRARALDDTARKGTTPTQDRQV